MGDFNVKHLLNPFDKRNPLRPDNLAKDPLGLKAHDLLTDPKKQPTVNADGTFAAPASGYEKAYNAFVANGSPGANGAERGSSAWNNAFNAWAGKAMELNGAYEAKDRGEVADPMDLWNDNWDLANVTNVVAGNTDGNNSSGEKGFYDYTMENYVYPDLEADKQRQQIAADIIAKYQPELDSQRQLISDIVNVGPDGRTAALNTELTQNGVAIQAQLAALDEQMASMQGNLSAELAAKAQSLREELAALSGGLTQYTEAERAALAQRLATNYQALETEVASKKQNLQTALDSMGQAVTAQDAAKKAALEQEIASLTAAQAPMAEARIQGAEVLASSINLGVQSTRDQIVANAAQQGFLGTDSGTEGALMRATLAARADAANKLSDAKLANASDTREIARYGAEQLRGVSDETTGNRFNLSNFGATETRGLGDYDATGRKAIADLGAESEQGIASTDAQGRLQLSQYGAGQNRTLADYGSGQTRTLGDYGATEKRNIKDTGAQRQLSYFSNDLTRRLAALSLPGAAVDEEFRLRTSADNFGQSGLKRSQDNMNWFKIGTSSAPSAVINQTSANGTMGSALSNVGAGLVGLAGQVGNANNWWSKPAATPSYSVPKTSSSFTGSPSAGTIPN